MNSCLKFTPLHNPSHHVTATAPGPALTGRGGAPKFLKNWLTFASSPYDPDHILGLRDDLPPPRGGGGPLTHSSAFSAMMNCAWGYLILEKRFHHKKTKRQRIR